MKTPSRSLCSEGAFVALAFFLPAGLAPTCIQAAPDTRPNVLFIAIDDFRPELGCYGAPQVKTPHIDRLAAQGLRFERAYCPVAVCGASRASLMTSVMPTPDRFKTHATWAERDAANADTLPQVFREAGYVTLANGKIFHHAADTADRSWSEKPWSPPMSHSDSLDPATKAVLSQQGRGRMYESPDVPDNAYKDGKVAERTIADLQRLKEGGKPFFLACGFIRPHMPFYAPKRYWDLYRREDIEIAPNRGRPENAPAALKGSSEYKSYHPGEYQDGTEAWHRMMRHGYYACASYADKLTGDVLAELDRLGLAENTIVVLWGDHGWHLGEHGFWGKHNTLHQAIRVPFIMRVPGKASGNVTHALVETIDIFPTLCELAGLSVPDTAQGRSFATLLDRPEAGFREDAYSRYGTGDAVVTEGMTYTRYLDGSEMLYDLRSDPEENANVVASAKYAEALAMMRRLLDARLQEAAGAKVTSTPGSGAESGGD